MGFLGATIKDAISNVVSFALVVLGAVNAYLQSIGTGEIDWFQLAVFVAGAIISYLTGKGSNAKAKKLS